MTLLVIVPAWFILQSKSSFIQYDPAETHATLAGIQQQVDALGAGGGQVLFITQRHLIAMKMLTGVKLIPQYEREELMEMAMADNEQYLQVFYADLRSHRFAAIIVDPLQVNYLGSAYPLGEENDAWDRRVAKPILCNYRQQIAFPSDQIVIYVPQSGVAQCP